MGQRNKPFADDFDAVPGDNVSLIPNAAIDALMQGGGISHAGFGGYIMRHLFGKARNVEEARACLLDRWELPSLEELAHDSGCAPVAVAKILLEMAEYDARVFPMDKYEIPVFTQDKRDNPDGTVTRTIGFNPEWVEENRERL